VTTPLLKTRLLIPPARIAIVSPPQLIARLDSGATCTLTIIASRSDSFLPLSHWHAGNQITELRTYNLHLSTQEAISSLSQVMALDGKDIITTKTRTEGY